MNGDHELGHPRRSDAQKHYDRPRPADPADRLNIQVPWAYMLRHDWDRLLLDLCFLAFGVWGLIFTWTIDNPIYTMLIRIVYSIFDVQFLLVGLLLLASHRTGSRKIRYAAYQVYVMALVLLAIVVFVASRSPFAILILGFALHGVVLGRLTRRQEQVRRRVSELVREDDISSM
jgi:hypothetical protein